jgi:hypothetical protein
MLLELSSHISMCLERVADAERRARESTNPVARRENELMAQSWDQLARSYQFVQRLERFLSEAERRKTLVRPFDIPSVVEQEPAATVRQVVPRLRVKHKTSFQDRLLKAAQEAREQAELQSGADRNRLLLKAQQCEAAAKIDKWASSPVSEELPNELDFSKKPKP